MEADADVCYRALEARDPRFDGRFYVGVATTGIYCRPICPARTPLRRNVRFYPTAAAAQAAGFRPCLRCRPECAPDTGAWRGASATVSRALALIEAGALDGGDVEALAGRLGMGGRQLRRLLHDRLGAAPLAIARTRRVLLAKQLIQETSMSMAAIACAAGFGSIRRFNEVFQQMFGRAPATLRRGAPGPAVAGGGIALRLPYRPPYAWDPLVTFFSRRAIDGVEVVEPGRYARAFRIDGAPVVVCVTPGGGRHLLLQAWLEDLSSLPAVIARARQVFDLAADPEAIAAHLAASPLLAALLSARPGLRVPGAWDGFEMGVRAILGQQVSVSAATALAARLVREHGEPLPAALAGALPGVDRLFPTPARLAAADWSGFPMPRARSAAIVALARAALDDPHLFGRRGDLGEAIVRFRSLPGIGEWTAHYLALRALGEPDAFPAADVGLMRALRAPDGPRPTAAAILTQAESWRPWRAYAALHLWASLDDATRPEETTHACAA